MNVKRDVDCEKPVVSHEKAAVGSLLVTRMVYAVNTLNVSAIFYLIGKDIGGGVNGLALLTSVFYIGIGSMQLPAGILAMKWGPKRVVILGVVISSLAVMLTSLSISLLQLSILRLIVGAGMALVFAPAIMLLARLLGRGRSGNGVGLFNSANAIGGLIGLFAWILIASAIGWRLSLGLGGVLGLGTGLLLMKLVPDDGGNAKSVLVPSKLGAVLKDPTLILMGLGVLAMGVGYALESNFMTYYLSQHLGVTPALAGLIASIVVVIPIFSSIWGGRTYDKVRRPKLLIAISGLGLAGSLLLCAVPSVYAAVVGTTLGGVTFGIGLTVAFAAAADHNRVGREHQGFAIAWVNCISLAGLFWVPLVFSGLAVATGYSSAWVGGAGIVVVLTLPYVLLAKGDTNQRIRND